MAAQEELGFLPRDSWAGEVISCLSLSFLICTMSCYLSKNEWMPAGFHFWVIGCILDDSWHSSHPALARKTRGPVLMKEAGVREHQRLKDARRRVWALFPWRAGPAKPIRAQSSCGQREAAGSEGIQTALSHPLPHQPALCKNSKLPIKPPSLSSFIHLPIFLSSSLLFYPNS